MGTQDCLEQDKLETAFTGFLNKHPDIKTQTSLAVAVSGGPDSMALAHFICQWSVLEKKEIHILTVDHGLRDAAKAEAEQVARWTEQQNAKNITHQILRWEGDKPDTSIMEEARHARYDLIADYCQHHNIKTVFVAHHQNDQAETFLIRFAKGSGLDGLAGMSALQSYSEDLKIARPFLNISKQNLIKYCDSNAVDFASDPSNENEKYLRPRLRQSMTVLEKEGLTPKRLASLSNRLRRARHALEVMSERAYQNCLKEENEQQVILNFNMLSVEPEEITFRVVKRAAHHIRGHDGYGIRMDRLESLLDSLLTRPELFKPRTLGGLIFALKDKNSALYIEKE